MTLILGLESKGGLLLVSDSQVTVETGGQPVKMTGQKIFAPWSNIAFGGSGRVGVVQQVQQHLEAACGPHTRFAGKRRHEIRKDLAEETAKKVREIVGRAIPIQGAGHPLPNLLFVGYAEDGPFILEIHPDLTDTDHIDAGYAAIGSGEIFPYFALASLRHYNVRNRTLGEARLVAHRVVQDAISVAAHGLGPPVQMVEIAKPNEAGQDVNARILDDDEIRILDEKVIEWKEAESEALTRFVGLTPEPARAETMPTATPEATEGQD